MKTYATSDKLPAADVTSIVQTAGVYATDAGGDDTYAITVTPVPTSYADGDEYTFKSSTGNTAAATLNVNSLGAKNIKRLSDSGSAVDLMTGDIIANRPVRVKYDGTQFILMNPPVVVKSGQSSRTTGSGTGTVDITHGLTCKPRFIRITAFLTRVPSGANYMTSQGSYDVLADTQHATCISAQSAGSGPVTQDATHIINCTDSGQANAVAAVVAANVNDSTFRLNFTTMTGATCYFEYEVEA